MNEILLELREEMLDVATGWAADAATKGVDAYWAELEFIADYMKGIPTLEECGK